MNYFTSDIHFADWETMKHDMRPFASISQYDKYVINLWNKMMNKNDTLYVIGDLFDYNIDSSIVWEKTLEYIKKIKAQIVLIIGNNEERVIDSEYNGDFEAFRKVCITHGIKDVMKNHTLEFCGKKFFLTHKPEDHNNSMENLMGHLHKSRGQWYSFGINVACDLNYFRPYSENDILFLLNERDIYYFSDNNFKFV